MLYSLYRINIYINIYIHFIELIYSNKIFKDNTMNSNELCRQPGLQQFWNYIPTGNKESGMLCLEKKNFERKRYTFNYVKELPSWSGEIVQ